MIITDNYKLCKKHTHTCFYRFDFLHIYDGVSTADTQIGSPLTGNTKPNDIFSSGQNIYLNLISDFETTETGFRIQFDAGKLKMKQIHDCNFW